MDFELADLDHNRNYTLYQNIEIMPSVRKQNINWPAKTEEKQFISTTGRIMEWNGAALPRLDF